MILVCMTMTIGISRTPSVAYAADTFNVIPEAKTKDASSDVSAVA
jgi:hypothetical protein